MMADWGAVWDTGVKPGLSGLENRVFIVRLRGLWFLALWGNIKRTLGTTGLNYFGFPWGRYKILMDKDEVQLSYDLKGNNRFVRRILDGLLEITAPDSIPGRPDFIGEFRFRFWKKHRRLCRFTLTEIAETVKVT